MSDAILTASRVFKSYGQGHTRVEVLKGADLEIARGEMVSVVGASGSGKSTLLNVLGLLDAPDAGEVLYKGENVNKMLGGRRDLVRNTVFGFVFQFYHLLGEFTALENVLMPLMIRQGCLSWPAKQRSARERAGELLEQFGLGARMRHRPSQLSGGEQQRVAIARALIGEPEILLCDEPTGNLDSKTGREIVDVLMGLNARGQSMVVVTHDANLASLRASRGRARRRARYHENSGRTR